MGWFWNNPIMNKIEAGLITLTNKLWRKRREHEKKLVEKIKEQNKVKR